MARRKSRPRRPNRDPDELILELQSFLGIPFIVETMGKTRLFYSTDRETLPHGPGDRRLTFKARGSSQTESGHYVVRIWPRGGFHYIDDDSYKRGYQIDGTNGLCMLFACMIFRNETRGLSRGNWVSNVKIALRWALRQLRGLSSDLQYEIDAGDGYQFETKLSEIRTYIRYILTEPNGRYASAIATGEEY